MRRLTAPLCVALVLLLAGCPPAPKQPTVTGGTGTSGTPAAGEPPLLIWCDPGFMSGIGAVLDDFADKYPPGFRVTAVERGALLKLLGVASSLEAPDPGQPADAGAAPASPAVPDPAEASESSEAVPDYPYDPDEKPVMLILGDRQLQQVLINNKQLAVDTLRTCAGDRLALVCRQGEKWRTSTLFDIYSLRFKQLGVGDPLETTLGLYTDQALTSDGVKQRVADRLRPYDETSAVLNGLLNSDAELAICFASQLPVLPEVQPVLVISEDLHEDIRYVAAVVAGRATQPHVHELLVYLAEDPEVQSAFVSRGYLDRTGALRDN